MSAGEPVRAADPARPEGRVSAHRAVSFADRLAEILAAARHSGQLSAGEYEALLVAADFDPGAFQRFQAAALEAGVALPVDEPDEPAEAAGLRAQEAGRERDLLDVYLGEIGRIALIEHRELLALAARARAGDEAARKRIILGNLRLVVHLARAYRNRGLPMLDLIEEGNLGLISAVDHFEPGPGRPSTTYPTSWTRKPTLPATPDQPTPSATPAKFPHPLHPF